MDAGRIKVSIGIPVFNGEKYLSESVESILSQTFGDYEIIISDNASTDRTADISQQFASKYRQIKYFRQPKNVGAVANFNRCFKLASGEYFRWQADDDLIHPDFLKTCVEVLDRKPEVVLVFPATQMVSADRKPLEVHRVAANTQDPDPIQRFSNLMLSQEEQHHELFGLIRSKALHKTSLLQGHAASERALLAQLALQGPFKQLSEPLLICRRHPEQSSWILTTPHERLSWQDTDENHRTSFPQWSAFKDFQLALLKSSLPASSKLFSQWYFLKYLRNNRLRMTNDLRIAWKGSNQNDPK